jgi:hypothetical protein
VCAAVGEVAVVDKPLLERGYRGSVILEDDAAGTQSLGHPVEFIDQSLMGVLDGSAGGTLNAAIAVRPLVPAAMRATANIGAAAKLLSLTPEST